MAFYDATERGNIAARAYLVTTGQFSDIAAQEMYQEPGKDLDITQVLATGREEIGPGRYETIVCPGFLEGSPVLTFTAPWTMSKIEPNKPSGRYLMYLASGLAETHGWSTKEVANYLANCPGAAGEWASDEVEELIRSSA